MFDFVKRLFGIVSVTEGRAEAALERFAVAFEGLAADAEIVRAAFRDRLGVLETPRVASDEVAAEASLILSPESTPKKGRKTR